MPEENSLILHVHELLQYLNRQGAATFMTVAQHGLVGDMKAPVDVTYLADTVIPAALFRGARQRAACDVGHQEANRHARIDDSRISHRQSRT
jgi:circadian clock protein KaiC